MSVRDWDRLPGESDKAFAAARKYFEAGAGRSIRGVAADANQARQFAKWSARFEWVQRAAAFDAHLAQTADRALERELERTAPDWAARLERLRERAWTLSSSLLDRAELMLQFPLTQVEEREVLGGKTIIRIIKPVRFNMRTAASLVEIGAKVGALAAAPETDGGTDTPASIRIIYEEPEPPSHGSDQPQAETGANDGRGDHAEGAPAAPGAVAG